MTTVLETAQQSTEDQTNTSTPEGANGQNPIRGMEGLAAQQQALSPGGQGGYDQQAQALRPTAPPAQPAPAAVRPAAVNPAVARTLAQVTPQERQRLLRQNDDAIDDIEDLLSYGAFDWNVTQGEALRAIRMLEGMGSHSRIVAIQELNTRNGAVTDPLPDRMMENLDAGQKAAHPKTILTMMAVKRDVEGMKAMFRRSPSSHGVRPGMPETALAMRVVPESAIVELARSRNAGHAQAWLAATPAPVGPPLRERFQVIRTEQQAREAEATEAREARAEQVAELDTDSTRRMQEDQDFAALIHNMEDFLSYGVFDWAITDSDARQAYAMLCGIGNPSELRAAVFQLDRNGFMDRLLDNLPQEVRWADRSTFLGIISARQPEKNVAFARELLSYGVFDWAITDEDARLAFQIARQLPVDIRREFQEQDGGQWWERMEGNLSTEDASDRDANFYQNQEQSQQLKLNFQENCATMPAGQVRMQAEMLARMGEVDFVESAMNTAGLDSSTDPIIMSLYGGMGLATNSTPRNTQVFEAWRDNQITLPDDGNLGSTIAEVFGALGFAIDAAIGDEPVTHTVDLNRLLGATGGQAAGITLGDRQEGDDQTNTATIGLHAAAGTLSMDLPSLSIASINTMADTVQLQTGAINVGTVHVDIKWPTANDPSSHFNLTVASASVENLWQVTDSDMTGVGRLEIGALSLRAERAQGEVPEGMGDGIGLVMAELTDTFTQLAASIQLESAEPGPLANELGSSLMGGMGAHVSLESLTVTDYASSSGDYVGQVSVETLAVDMDTQLRTDQLRTRISELEVLETRTEEQEAQLTASRADLESLATDEARFNELLAKQNQPEQSLETWERAEMQVLRDRLTVMSGSVSVGALSVTDARMGNNEVDSVSVTNLEGSMTSRHADGEQAGAGSAVMESSFSVGTMNLQGARSAGTSVLEAYEARHAEVRARIQAGDAQEGDIALCDSLFADIQAVHRDIEARDELRLVENLDAEGRAELTRLNGALGPWTDLTGAMSVDSVVLTEVAGTYNAQDNVLGMTMGSATATGITQDGMTIDSVAAQGVTMDVDMAGTMNSMSGSDDLMSQLTSVQVGADNLDVTGVEMRGDRPSVSLREELNALELQQRLNPTGRGALTEAQQRRLSELPDKITEANTNEAALDTLRAIPTEELTADQADDMAELQAWDATYTRVAAVNAQHVTAGFNGDTGQMNFGVQGDEENAGLTVTDVNMGRVVGGEEVADTRVDSVTAQSLGGTLQSEEGEMPDFLAIDQEMVGLDAHVEGTGIQVNGYTGGQEGTAGYQHLDSASMETMSLDYSQRAAGEGQTVGARRVDLHTTGANLEGYTAGVEGEAGHTTLASAGADSLDVSYDSTVNGGSAAITTQGAHLEGYSARSDSRIATLREAVRVINRTPEEERTPLQNENLASALRDIGEYDELLSDIETARSSSRRRRLERQLADWDNQSTTTLDSLTSGTVHAEIGGLGNIADEGFDPMSQSLSADVTADTIGVEGYGAAIDGRRGMTLESAELNGLEMHGTNVLSEQGRQLGVDLESVEARGYRDRDGGTWARRVNAEGIHADVNGQTVGTHIDSATVRGAGSGGNSVGYARVSDTDATITNLGERDQRTSATFGSVSASTIRSRTEGMETNIAHLRGRTGNFSMGPNGQMAAGLRTFSGDGLDVTQSAENDEGVVETSNYGVGDFSGTGATYSADNRGMNVGVGSMTANTVTASGAATGNRQVEVGTVTVDGLAANMQENGDFGVTLDAATASDIHSTNAQGELSTVGSASLTNLSASGNMHEAGPDGPASSTLDNLNIGTVEIRDATVDDDGTRVNLELATVTNVHAANVDFTDTENVTGNVGFGSAEFQGRARNEDGTVAAPLFAQRDENSPDGWTEYHADSGRVGTTAVTMHGGGQYTGSVEGVHLEGADMRQDLMEDNVSNGHIIGERRASADQLDVGTIGFGANTTTGQFNSEVSSVSGSGVNFTDRYDVQDATHLNQTASVEDFEVTGVRAGGNYQTGAMGFGYQEAQATEVAFTRGDDPRLHPESSDATNGFVDFASDEITAGGAAGDVPASYVMFDEDGRVSGDLQALRLGPNTDGEGLIRETARWGSDPNNHLTLGSGNTGEAGEFTVDRLHMENFNPSDLNEEGSTLQAFGVSGSHFVLNTGADDGVTVYGDGVELESVFVQGQGNDRMLAGATGIDAERLRVFQARNPDTNPELRREIFDGEGIHSDGGYALTEGSDFALAHAHLDQIHGDRLEFRYELPETDPQQHREDWENRPDFDPERDRVVVEALQGANGTVDGNYRYNRDDGGFWEESWARVVTGRDAAFSAELENGGIRGDNLDVDLNGGLGSTIVDWGLMAPFQLGFNGAATADRHLGDGGHLGPQNMLDRFYNDDADSYNTYKPPGDPQDMDRIDLDVSLQDVGGGRLQYGRTFGAEMQDGASLEVHGNAGERLDVEARNLGFNNVDAMDGDVSIGEVEVGTVNVTIRDMQGGRGDIHAVVEEGTVRNLDYTPVRGGDGESSGTRATVNAADLQRRRDGLSNSGASTAAMDQQFETLTGPAVPASN